MAEDIERQVPKNDGINGSEQKIARTQKAIQDHLMIIKWRLMIYWDVILLVLCIVAVAVDPLFLYLPVINEATKCITIDHTLQIIASCVRSFLDLVACWDFAAGPRARKGYYTRVDGVINTLSVLPVAQVLVPIISKMSGSKLRILRKFLNAAVLLQYVPRIFRIYRLWIIVNQTISLRTHDKIIPNNSVEVNAESNKNPIPLKGFIVMKAGFNLLLYLVASHALGAFWYFFSIERQTTCWIMACDQHDINGCSKGISLDCGTGGFGNYTFLNDFCSIENPNTTFFDFGIFKDALQSDIVASMDFPRKTMFCFWWGLRNLISFAQNLQTSTYYWENCFTVIVSIFGLLLFLYFIGNLQVYMQSEAEFYMQLHASNKLGGIMTYKRNLEGKIFKQTSLSSLQEWISTMGLSDELKNIIMAYATPILENQNNDFDTENPFPRFPTHIKRLIKRHLCLPLLKKVPIFKNESEELLYEITNKFLKHRHYNQRSYIVQEKEPLEVLIFIVKGKVLMRSSNHGNKSEYLKAGDFFGGELVEWVLESPEPSNFRLSTWTLKCQTKVEGFYLTASDLKDMMSQFWWKFSKFRCTAQSDSQQLKHFAASSIQEAWHRHAIHTHKVLE